jgi:hypothetical protein
LAAYALSLQVWLDLRVREHNEPACLLVSREAEGLAVATDLVSLELCVVYNLVAHRGSPVEAANGGPSTGQ